MDKTTSMINCEEMIPYVTRSFFSLHFVQYELLFIVGYFEMNELLVFTY